MSKIKLEIAVFSVEAALAAIEAGADRIEFCENPLEGGTTPSFGSLSTLISLTSKSVFPIIRPRGGDFLYSQNEFNSIRSDVLMARKLDYPGIVIGLLNADGSIDIEKTKRLVDLASPMEVTFHRAFDRCKDPFKALEDIISTGCKRILTSGQVPNAADALPLLKKLIQQAGDRIIVMPGSGVRSNNIKEIIQATGAKEVHSSARQMQASQMNYTKDSMKENMQATGVDVGEIKKMLEHLHY
ncbi:MAG: copper homeostasis protein CutC [Chitinophagia bacterium]|nr:copper homeostasis protein CutC [Chitinophagia bacterium]NCA30215.1 copper homeostasis protein CutC [Chitinophagia bacterium]NDD15564.1 copper homeostasis protein CutC [Chitinophagia bacterium]